MIRPLDGVTVVTVEQAVATPLATRNLADLGARVIKVERPEGGDFARDYDRASRVPEHTSSGSTGARNRSRSTSSRRKGATRCDASSTAPTSSCRTSRPAPRSGSASAAPSCARDRPELIVVNLSGYGIGGPMEQRKAYDMLVQAESGLIAITGTPGDPGQDGHPHRGHRVGHVLRAGGARRARAKGRTGEGATIDVSMFEATVEWMGYALYTQMYTGAQPARMGLSHSSIAPYDAFPTRDGQMLIGVQNDRGWRTLVSEVLDVPELADDPRFATNVQRVANRAECDAALAAQTSRWSTEELAQRLAAAGVPAAQVKELDAVVEHPQLHARDRWRTIATEHAQIRALLPPATFADVDAVMGDVPALGQHTRSLLRNPAWTRAPCAS